MKDPLLLLLISGVSGVYCSHSLQFYGTALSVSGLGLPEYTLVGFVNMIQIIKYNSDIGRAVPVAPWVKKLETEYWVIITQIGKEGEAVFKQEFKTYLPLYNLTGFHSIQQMTGCELRDDGNITGYNKFGFDGKDFLALDMKHGVYDPLSDWAQIIAQKLNSPDERQGERDKRILETLCIEWLKKVLQYGKEELDRKVRPEVKVSDQKADAATKIYCHVYGFCPKAVDVNWKRDDVDVPSDEPKQVLPNTDGTYQITVTVEVPLKDTGKYTCHVEHISLEKPLIVNWEPRSNPVLWIVIGVIAVLGVIGIAVGFVIWKKLSGQNHNSPSIL
ncbi:class I histocompatibility antigen, F10 alpha chain-like [Pelobates fuscus]|uniref:class I histocompatibility antigen, F10 alpha chain-like n=1 Tax=Pelobates fuscus TaxID=191477 RepID=UPI002FE4DC43